MSTDTIDQDITDLKRQASELTHRIKKLEDIRAKRQRCNNRTDEVFCLLKNNYLPLDKLLTLQFPDLIENHDFWQAFLRHKDKMPLVPEAYYLLKRYQPHSILHDKNLMLQLCLYDSWIYNAIPEGNPLKHDAQILETVLLSNPSYIQYISNEVLAQHADLTGATLARLPLSVNYLFQAIKNHFSQDLWYHREIVLGWAKGGGIYHNAIPERFLNDKAVIFQFQENRKIVAVGLDIPDPLRKDKHTMMALVKSNPENINRIATDLVGDADLPIAALSTPRGTAMDHLEAPFIRQWIPHEFNFQFPFRNQHIFLFRVANVIRLRLQSHDTFVKLILCSIRSSAEPLAILNQGHTTESEAYAKPIAKFVGIPMGKELRNLRGARQTLTLLGIHWSDPPHEAHMKKELEQLRTTQENLKALTTHET